MNKEIYDNQYLENVHLMTTNNKFRELHTLLDYDTTCRSDFKCYADDFIHLTVKTALDHLPHVPYEVMTPPGNCFQG
ncbi:unnamed protein product [Rotaria sp. Silwood1]|nr:unnamed protein product [Rotaria sp. Silwood1]CAF1633479.1 unnamed protein product [Rotaria sp. Silwood1]CAF3522248.1 unnamed protein product [Rotaria sp. Silwood1]CAF4780636.1 unnamed protein product [Rotaria sp. Silwood1]